MKIKMLKTRTLNKTVSTVLILLLTLSILSVINININIIPQIPTVHGTNITAPSSGISVNTTGFWAAGKNFNTTIRAGSSALQAAVDNATAGATYCNITVMEAGTYNITYTADNTELVVATPLYLKSDVGTGAIINSTTDNWNDIKITSDDVIIDGFTIADNGTLGSLVRYQSANFVSDNLTIRNNIFISRHSSRRVIIDVYGRPATNLTIRDNTFDFQLATAITTTPWDTQAPGCTAADVLITNNTFVSTHHESEALGVGNLNNTFITYNTFNGTALRYGQNLDTVSDNITIAHNIFNGNTTTGNDKYTGGLEIKTYSGATANARLKNLDIYNNTFRNFANYGIIFRNFTQVLASTIFEESTISVYYNNFENITQTTPTLANYKGAVWSNVTDVTINATYNWWSHAWGPCDVGHGVGQSVSNYVTYDPWLSAAYPAVTTYSGLVLNYTSAPPNTFVHVTCANTTFTGGEDVKLYFPSTPSTYLKTVTAETNGTIWSNFTVPELTHGTYTLTAIGQTSGTTKTASFAIPQPTITLSPTHGSVGTTVTITGQNFNISDSQVEVLFDSTSVKNATSGTTGSISDTFTVPSKTAGTTYTVNASDGINYRTASFTIPTFAISLNVSSGPSNTPLQVNGTGFTINGLVKVFFDEVLQKTLSANATGDFSTSFAVPEKTATAYTVKGWDTGTGNNATKTFTIPAPSINLNTTSGLPAQTIEAWGANWNCSGYVSIYFDSTSVLSPANNQTNSTGYLGATNNMTFVVPNITNGIYTVNATDGINSDTSLTFTIAAPTLTLNTTGGPVGAHIMINGTNWKLGASINIDIHNSTYSTDLATATAHATHGNFTTSFTVPSLDIGTYTINATDGITNHNTTISFNVGCAITISPSSDPANSTITVNGNGFSANKNHTIWWESTLKATVNATGAGGSFTTTFTIPNQAAGTYSVWAQDSVTLFKTANVTFTVNTPSIGLSPTSGTAGTQVTVTGTNFQINSTVTVIFVSMTVNSTARTSNTGTFTATFNVPANYTGAAYTVNATASAYINSAIATFTVTGGTGIDAVLDMLRHSTYGLEEIKTEIEQILTNLATMQTDITTIKSHVIDIEVRLDSATYGLSALKTLLDAVKAKTDTIVWTDITTIKGYVDDINWTDITTIKTEITAIEAKLDSTTYGLSALKTLLDAVKAKTDTINWADVTAIKTAVTHVSTRKFDFGTTTSLWEPGFIQVTPSTNYTASQGYGWTNTTGLYARDRGSPDYTRRDFVFSSENRTFQVDLTSGDYTVIVTLGDQSYSHDNMNITVEGSSATVNNTAGTFVQKVFHVTVTGGSLTVTMKDDGGADSNWVINTLIIEQSWK